MSIVDEVDFPPIRNGLDYLLSVVDHLACADSRVVTPRELKYAVLHLQAAAEVLLKARLQGEHWSLVFKNPGQASEERFRKGDFESCSIDEAVRRLRQIVGIDITDAEEQALKALAQLRNSLQHYGLTRNARAVEARAGEVIDFLARFLEGALLTGLPRDEWNEVTSMLGPIRDGLNNIQAFVTQRMKRISGKLAGSEDHTIRCPDCSMLAMVVQPDADGGLCHFCGVWQPDPSRLVYAYYAGRPLTNDLVSTCPHCHAPTLAREVQLLSAPDQLVGFCFTCRALFPHPTDD